MRAWGPTRIHCAGVNEESEKEWKEREMVKWVCQQRAVLKPTQCGGNLKWLTAPWTTLPFSSRNAGGSLNTSTTYFLGDLQIYVAHSLHSYFCHATGQEKGENYSLSSPSSLNRPNKLRDHGKWLRAVFVCRCVCVYVCEEKAWGIRRIHSAWVNEFCCDDIQKQDDPSWD